MKTNFFRVAAFVAIFGEPFSALTAEIGPGSSARTNVNHADERYVLRAGGPVSYNLLTNSPSSNKARIVLKKPDNGSGRPLFSIANGEAEEILLWNFRVQVRSSGKGTDGFGWDTVFDDYPTSNIVELKNGMSTTFELAAPTQAVRWRVCVLYSKRKTDEGVAQRRFSGNYEVISEEFDPEPPYRRGEKGLD